MTAKKKPSVAKKKPKDPRKEPVAPADNVGVDTPPTGTCEAQAAAKKFQVQVIVSRHHENLSHRSIDWLVKSYILRHLDEHPGCAINDCLACVTTCLAEDFGANEDAMRVLLRSLDYQLPTLHALRGGSQ